MERFVNVPKGHGANAKPSNKSPCTLNPDAKRASVYAESWKKSNLSSTSITSESSPTGFLQDSKFLVFVK